VKCISQIKISKKQARQFLLSYQGLMPPRQLKGKKDIYQYINKVGCIQFDPLDQVGYNPHLVLQSRVRDYRTDMLYDLLYCERKLVDDWDKNMSIYSSIDWPYFSRYRKNNYEKYR
jgi:uncharacterized protein YcaQ